MKRIFFRSSSNGSRVASITSLQFCAGVTPSSALKLIRRDLQGLFLARLNQ